jgi:hypothetical protein
MPTVISDEQALRLDRKIAEKIMGLKVVPDPKTYRGVGLGEAGERGEDLPYYCTQIEAAMEVWDHVRKKYGARWLLNADEEGFHLRRVVWVVFRGEKNEKDYTADKPLGWAKKIEDLPRVICEAALSEQKESLKEWVEKGMELEAQGIVPGTIGRKSKAK